MNKRSYIEVADNISESDVVDNISESDVVENISHENKKTFTEIPSEQWPTYYHPQGGFVKFTPWGSVRTYTDKNGEEVSQFQDVLFHEQSFDMAEEDYSFNLEQENYFGM